MNSTTATYDALGRMVEKGLSGTYTQFVFRPSGTILAVYSGSLTKGTVPLPGDSTAIYNASGLSYIRHTDWLGSSRLATTWAHAVYSKEAYAPFGETYNEAGTADRSFTGQDQDVVPGSGGSGVYDFLFRKYDPSAGRWLSPDPAGWGVVNQADPQSLDRYAYVENQPLNAVDPQGLEFCISSDGDLYTNGSSNTTCPNGWTDAGMAVIQMQTPQCPTCFLPPPPALSDFTDSFDSFDFGTGNLPPTGGGAPNNTSQPNNHCLAKAAGSALLHGSIDALSMVPVLGEGSAAISLGASLATNDYSDVTGTGVTFFGAAVGILTKPSTIEAVEKYSVRAAEGIPILGEVVGIGALAYDGYSAFQQYQNCMAGGG